MNVPALVRISYSFHFTFTIILDLCLFRSRRRHIYVPTKRTFTPPGAPQFNGAREAMVKMAKRTLMKTLEHADLTDEELQTAFCKAEALMNTRPLTVLSADPADEPPLTPAHFITGPPRTEMLPSDDFD